jgi:hypothetical protein
MEKRKPHYNLAEIKQQMNSVANMNLTSSSSASFIGTERSVTPETKTNFPLNNQPIRFCIPFFKLKD